MAFHPGYYVAEIIEDMGNINDKLEKEADAFSRDYLIPSKDYKVFAPSKHTSDAQIFSFANSIGIHPGVVAGRLQHDGILPANRCSQLKQKYKITMQ